MRFSLKTFLLTITLLGAGCGMFVHFKNHNPEALFSFLQMMGTIVPFILALGTVLWVAVKGSPPKNQSLIRWVSIIILVPVVIFIYLATGAGRGPYGMVASSYLVGPQFAGQIDNYQVWLELERRAKAGQLSGEEFSTSLESLIGAMELAIATKSASWQPGQPLSFIDGFLKTPAMGRAVSSKAWIRLLDLYEGRPTATASVTNWGGKDHARLNFQYGCPFRGRMPREIMWTTEFVLDGRPTVPERIQGSSHFGHADILIQGAGEHEIRIDFIRTYVPSTVGNGGITASPVKSWKVSKDYPLKTIPVTLKVTIPEKP